MGYVVCEIIVDGVSHKETDQDWTEIYEKWKNHTLPGKDFMAKTRQIGETKE